MAFNDDSDYNKIRTNLFKLLPEVFQSDTNRSVFENLFNRFLSKSETIKVSGYAGEGNPNALLQRQIPEPTPRRQAYQLQPVMYSKIGTIEHMMVFTDILNEISRLGVDTDRMKEWGNTTQFNWAPPIDFDKIINYSDYYWYDPDSNFTSDPQYITVKNPCTTAEAFVTEFERIIDVVGEELTIIDIDATNNSITVSVQAAEEIFINGFVFFVRDSTNTDINEKFFTVSSATSSSGNTEIFVQQDITDESIIDGVVSLTERLAILVTARDIACTGSAGWDVGLWDDNQVGAVLWDVDLLAAISYATLADWVTANGAPAASPLTFPYALWYNTTADTLQQWDGTGSSINEANWPVVQGNFSAILELVTGTVLWDQVQTSVGGMNASIEQWIDENKWLHKNDVPNFTVAKNAALPVIEYYSSVEINEWTYTTYTWKYRATVFDPWEIVDTEPFLIELLDPDYVTLRYDVDASSRTIILDERYGDLTSNFPPGTSFFIDNSTDNDGAYTVDYSTYAVDSLSDVGENPYRTRIRVIQTLNSFSSPHVAGSIRLGATSRGDPFVDFDTHWVFVGIDEVRPIPHQPPNLLQDVDPSTNSIVGSYTTTYGPYTQEYVPTVDGVTTFTLNGTALRPDSSRTLQQLAVAGFNDVRVYKNGVRQYGNYQEITTSVGSPERAAFVIGIEFDAIAATVTGDTIRIEVGEAAQDDLGNYLVYVRNDEDEATYVSNGKTPVSLIHYRKEEQVKINEQQYPLFDLYNLNGTPAYRSSPIFAYGTSQEAPIETNIGFRVVKSNDRKNYQFEQFLIDEDNGPMFAYRDYALFATQYWVSVEQLLVSSTLSSTATVHTWLQETWSKNKLQMNIFYMSPILSVEEPTVTEYPQFGRGSPQTLANGLIWYDLESQTLYTRDNSNVSFFWDELTDKVVQINDPTITTIWRTGHPTAAEYVPKYINGDREEVAVGNATGDWEVPNQLYYNPHHENRKYITLQELLNHFDQVIEAQPQIPGFTGDKNAQWRLLTNPNFGLGGTIHEYNDSYDSFLSATFERNVTPTTLFEFAHDQYESSLNELKEIYRRAIVGILVDSSLDFFDIGQDVADLIINQYELDDSRIFVFGDTTAFDGTDGIRNWIATLPMFFLAFRKTPYRVDDTVLDIHETVHHDGHRGTAELTPVTVESVILQTITTSDARAPGETFGIQSSLPPPSTVTEFTTYFPSGLRSHVYWYQVVGATRTLYRLQIKYIQSSTPPGGADPNGALWYDTTNQILNVLTSAVWGPYPISPNTGVIDPGWEEVDVNSILTDVIVEAEERLYAVSPDVIRLVFDFDSLQQTSSDIELYNSLLEIAFNAYIRQSEIEDAYSIVYNSTNAFTWNYVTSAFATTGSPEAIVGIVPYAGYDNTIRGGAYQDLYQKVYGTPYPHLEPWVLQGYDDKPSWWDNEYLNDDITTYGDRRWKYTHITASPITGSPIVSSGMWENIRLGIVPVGEELPDGITISTGAAGEARQYNYMSVNIGDTDIDNGSGVIEPDGLLPPYWDYKIVFGSGYTGPIRSLFHLLGTEVVSEDENFVFGDAGPVEWVWRNSSQFLYDQLVIAYKMQPVRLIHYTLGIDFLEVGQLQVNRRTNKVYSHKDTTFHGEIYNTNEILQINGILQWYVNYNRYLGYDINASDFGRLWVDWETPLGYQFGTVLDNNSFFISSDVIDITSSDYNITMKRSPGIDDYSINAFNIAPTKIPPSLLTYVTDSDWEFSFDTFSAFAAPVTCHAVRRYQFNVDVDTGICTLYTYPIVGVNTVNNTFAIDGNQTDIFTAGRQFQITGGAGHNGTWQVQTAAYAPGVDETRIAIDTTFAGKNEITSGTVGGKITAAYRTMPWSNGQEVYLSTTHTLPSPLERDRVYFVQVISVTQFRLMESQRELAVSTPITTFADEGTGNHFVGEIASSFTALGGAQTDTIWYHYVIDPRYSDELTIPRTVRGIQTLIDLIDGCVDWSEADGFAFNENRALVDPDTGRLVNWQVEQERFINSVFELRKTRNQRINTYSVSVDITTDTFTFLTVPPAWLTGTRISFTSTGILPSPLVANEAVYIIRNDSIPTQFTVAATRLDAARGTALDILSPGTGIISAFAKPVAPLKAPRIEVNAFRNSLWFRPDRGIVADSVKGPYTDVRANQLFQDQYQRPLRANNLKVFREDKVTEFRMLPEIQNDVDKRSLRLQAEQSTDPYNYIHITAGHVFLDGYEHILLFEDCTIDDNLIYDRYVGVNLKRVDLEFDRQPEFTLRPNLGGYFLSQNSSDPDTENKLIRNIEASAGDMQTFYDTHKAIETLPIMEYSRGLLGYEGIRDDLRQIQINPKAQFVFWRGMIQYKGAIDPIQAYINSRRFLDARVDEFWAYKIADFGDAREQEYPQMQLLTSDARTNDLLLHFVVSSTEAETGFTAVTLLDEERWFDQPDQRALLSDNGFLLYFEPVVGSRLNLITGSPNVLDTAIVKHNFKGDGLVVTFQLYEDGTQSGFVIGSPTVGSSLSAGSPTTFAIMPYIPGTGMIDVFANGQQLQSGTDYTEGTASPILTTQLTITEGSPTRNIVVVYKSGRLLETVHFERVNSKIIRFNSNLLGVTFQSLSLWNLSTNRAVFNPAKVRDILSDVTLYNITLWDPARGYHYYNAIGEIELQRGTDPARYTNTRDTTALSEAYWSEPETGTTWLDTSNQDYVPYYDSQVFTLDEQLVEWGRLADWGTVAAYEWVESDVLPSEWDALAAQQIGDSSIAERDRKTGTARKALFSRARDHFTFTVTPQRNAVIEVPLDTTTFGSISGSDATGLLSNAVQTFRVTSSTPGSPEVFTLASEYIPGQNLLTVTLNGNTLDPNTDFNEISSTEFTLNVAIVDDDVVTAVISAPDYLTQVSVDGTNYVVTINGNDAQTFDQLVSAIADDIPSGTVELTNNKIVITSGTVGSSSSVIVNDAYSAVVGLRLFGNLPLLIGSPLGSPLAFTGSPLAFVASNTGVDTVFLSLGHTFVNGDTVLVSSTGELPTGLEESTEYVVTNAVGTPSTQFQLQGIEVTDIGSGIHTVAAATWPTTWNREQAIKVEFDALTDIAAGSPTGFSLVDTGIEINDTVNVYVNGKLAESNVLITKTAISVADLTEADTVTIIKPKHIITSAESAFDPDVEDDGTVHVQYVEDYDYTRVTKLDESSGDELHTYYFWVKATTTRVERKVLSLAEVEEQLVTIPTPYMIFRNLEIPETRTIEEEEYDLPDRYTQAIVRGLRGVINSDERYTLRFTRDFTLRDSLSRGQSALDLKQLHSEWKLFRQEQLFSIDRYLWNKVTESMVGFLLTDNTVRVPSLERELYDTTFGTDTRFGLRDGQAFVDGDLAKASILAYLTDPDIDFQPVDIAVFFEQETFTTNAGIVSAMDTIYNTFSFEHTNRMFFSVLQDAFSQKVKYPDIFKTSMIALHGIRILEVEGIFDD